MLRLRCTPLHPYSTTPSTPEQRWFSRRRFEETLRLLLITLLLYHLNPVVGVCATATDQLPGGMPEVPSPPEFGTGISAKPLRWVAEQQPGLLPPGALPGSLGPSRWGLLLGAGSAALLLSLRALLAATRPVEAIFSFLLLLLSLLLPLLQLEAEYVGAIHLMVYPGAILIFFSFATLTTDQLGHWDQPRLEGAPGSAGGLLSRLLGPLAPLLVAAPLLLLWWTVLGHRLGFSPQNRAPQRSFAEESSLLPPELLRSSDMVALGLEIFQRRLLSLTLLGLLLLLAFLTALELLTPRHRRRSSSLFPRLGAGGALGLLSGSSPKEPLPRSLAGWNHCSGDVWLLPTLLGLALGLGALATRRYAFLHSFLLLEGLGLLLNLFLVVVGTAADDLGGSVLVLFTVAVAAAETAVGLALFLALSQGVATATPAVPGYRRGGSGRRRLLQPPR